METEKEIEIRKDLFRKLRDRMRDSFSYKYSNRIGKNLSYVFFMSAWQYGRVELLKTIINELEFESKDVVIKGLYKKLDNAQEEVINHEEI